MSRIRGLFLSGAWAAALFGAGCVTTPQQITPEAQQALKAMSGVLAAANSFAVELSVATDEPDDSGRLVRISRHSRFVVSRPDRIQAETTGDDGGRGLWYRGTSLTLLDQDNLEYATITVPGKIDKMLDYIMAKYDLSLPLADLLFADPYRVLTEKVQTGTWIGRETVLGRACDHLLFTQENVDWQIWIETGKTPLPRRIVITRKNEPGSPEFSAIIDHWSFAAAPADDVFVFRAPQGAKAVAMPELLDAE